jgi:hypothetical protein
MAINLKSRKPSPFQPNHQGVHSHTRDVRPGMSTPQAPELRPVTKNFAGKEKRFHEVAVKGGMTHVKDGTFYAGVSRTQVSRAPDASGRDPLEPDYGAQSPKEGKHAPLAMGQKSNLTRSPFFHPELGAAILDGAVKSGSNKFPTKVRRS